MPTKAPRSQLTFNDSPNEEESRIPNPTRIALARRRRGFTQIELAAKLGIDRKSVSAYESGKHAPVKADGMAKLAAILGFPESFFFGDDLDEPSLDSGSFRSLSKMTASQCEMAKSQAALGLHFSAWLDKKFGLPKPQIPDFGREPEPEAAAESVRREWALGTLSIRNMVHLLEAKGVGVFSLAIDAREVDAFSMWKGGKPFVFLNANKTPEHSRFDAAHELGHLVLHKHGPPQGKEAEREANQFASAFLMPRGSVLGHAPRFPTYQTLVSLKKRWAVSVAALAYRLHVLDLMTDWQYRGICVEIAKLGKDCEPNSIQREGSLVLPKLLGNLYESGISRSRIAEQLCIPLSELEQLLFGLTITGVGGGGKRQTNLAPTKLSRIK